MRREQAIRGAVALVLWAVVMTLAVIAVSVARVDATGYPPVKVLPASFPVRVF